MSMETELPAEHINTVKNPKWIQAFINKKGLDHLAKIIMDRNIEKENYKTFTMVVNFFCEAVKFSRAMNVALPFKEQFLLEMFKIPKFGSEDFAAYFTSCVSVLKELSSFKDFNSAIIFKHTDIRKIL